MFALPAPITVPVDQSADRFPVRRVFCVGRNYAAHAREMGGDERDPPFFFTKWAETVVPIGEADGGGIAYPPATSRYEHEVELVVAIGLAGADIAAADAEAHVFGYAVGLDMTRRDLQLAARELGRPWDTAKNVAQSAPIAPIASVARAGHVRSGAIAIAVNGQRKQHADIADMIWSVPEILSYLSALYRLEAGDLVFTGTPAGVGPVQRGDRLEASIAGLPPLALSVV